MDDPTAARKDEYEAVPMVEAGRTSDEEERERSEVVKVTGVEL